MVRLKDDTAGVIPVHKKFQFHYGTIKRVDAEGDGRVGIEFQFHYGTIKRGIGKFQISHLLISIPLWYD